MKMLILVLVGFFVSLAIFGFIKSRIHEVEDPSFEECLTNICINMNDTTYVVE